MSYTFKAKDKTELNCTESITKLSNNLLSNLNGLFLYNVSYDKKDLDFAYSVGDARFRVNMHMQSENIGLSARLIPKEIPSPKDLHFEDPLFEIPKLIDGLVLITGPTGCGNSTTIASLIEEINKERRVHIVTVEDPIEFLFEDKKS